MRSSLLPLLLFFLCLFTSCKKETVLSVDQISLSYTDAGGSQTVSLTANKPWSAGSNQSWCKVSPALGEEAASSKINISCDANTTYDARSCTVTFTCAELTKTISVTQATNNGLLVSQTTYELTKAAQQLNIQVQANVKFSVEVDAGCKDWITYKTTKGLTTNTVVLDIAENKSYDSREGKVSIKQDGGNLSSTITIKQSQLDGLFISTPEYNLSNEKHTLTVEVSTNVEFEVIPGAEWVKYVQTKGLNTKQVILEIAENDTYDQRETTVNVKQKNGDLNGTITIKQDENYGILVTQSEYNLSNEAQTIDVEVKFNVDFDVVIPDECNDWVSVIGTKGLSSRTYTFAITKNETYDNRECTITFKQTNGPLSGTVLIHQMQTDCIIPEKSEIEISAEEQQIQIKVESNIPFDVVVLEDFKGWITLMNTKSIDSSVFSFSISKNEGQKRIGRILLKGQQVEASVCIRQDAERNVVFDDFAFKSYCIQHFDTNHDNEISITEAKYITNIMCPNLGIQSLTGIEEFERLEQLYCPNNQLYTIDVSKNCKLRNLFCDFNHLVQIDLRGNPDLVQLQCSWNQITQLDLSENSALKTLSCNMNLLSSIDISKNTNLELLSCSDNQLKSLDISRNEALSILECTSNQLSELDVTNNKALTVIHCDNNLLKELNVNACVLLSELNCSSNLLNRLDISEATGLQTLVCSSNSLDYLNVENNVALLGLHCGANCLSSLDLDHNSAMTLLSCPNNQLSSLDLRHNTSIRSVDCYNNHLTELNVSNNTALTDLECSSNQLNSLDVSNNAALTLLSCENNNISELLLNKNTKLITLSCGRNQIKNLDLRNNTALKNLSCSSNQISLLDLEKNIELKVLYCQTNQLTSLDVTRLVSLTSLNCNWNSITYLDISNCRDLTMLWCCDNQLTALDLSNNLKLNNVWCAGNYGLYEIWLRSGQTISNFSYDTNVSTIKYK